MTPKKTKTAKARVASTPKAASPPAPPPASQPPVAEPAHGAALDRYDIAILHALQADARLTNTDLAARIGLSAAPTWRRVRWLEEQGYITGYRAEIDRRRIGLGVLAFVRVDAERNNATATLALEAALRALPEVVACHYISGSGTFELRSEERRVGKPVLNVFAL